MSDDPLGVIKRLEVADMYNDVMDAIDQELQSFQWSCGADRGNNRGEIDVDRDNRRLHLRVWCADNEDDDPDAEWKPLDVWCDIALDEAPREQIRSLIHYHLCHEADEQIWFGGERPFHPHAL